MKTLYRSLLRGTIITLIAAFVHSGHSLVMHVVILALAVAFWGILDEEVTQ